MRSFLVFIVIFLLTLVVWGIALWEISPSDKEEIKRIFGTIPFSGPLQGNDPLSITAITYSGIPGYELHTPVMPRIEFFPTRTEYKSTTTTPITIIENTAPLRYYPPSPPVVPNPTCQSQVSGCK